MIMFCVNFQLLTPNIDIYYPTAPHRVQITPKTSTNITWYLYSRRLVGQVCLLLTNQLAGFPVPILFHFAYLCHTFPVNKIREIRLHRHKTLACWVINLLLDVLFCNQISLRTFTRLYFDSPYGQIQHNL